MSLGTRTGKFRQRDFGQRDYSRTVVDYFSRHCRDRQSLLLGIEQGSRMRTCQRSGSGPGPRRTAWKPGQPSAPKETVRSTAFELAMLH